MTTENPYVSDPYTTTGPYVHKNPDGTYSAYVDGWHRNDHQTYDECADSLFWRSSHGYPIAYYVTDGDPEYPELVGDILCADCARAEWLADPSSRFQAELCEEQLESDVMCDECSAIIADQQCRLCFDSIHNVPWDNHHGETTPDVWYSDYYVAHRSCIAKAVVDHRQGKPWADPVTKVGKLAWRIDNNTYAPLERRENARTT